MMILETFLLFGFCACLVRATYEDIRWQHVKRSIWYEAGMVGLGMIVLRHVETNQSYDMTMGDIDGMIWHVTVPLLCFALIQARLFSKMYGRADCYAFVCCSIVLCAYGGGMFQYLLHMLLAILLLGGVQMVRGNVARDGNLKKPVAFVPYISVAFLMCMAGMTLNVIK